MSLDSIPLNALKTVIELAWIAISDDGKIQESDQETAKQIELVEEWLKQLNMK